MNGTSFGHDFAHALMARSIDNEYRQIERLYGPRTSWRFVRQSLSIGQGAKKYDTVTIRLADGQTRDVCFDVSSFQGTWPDHAAGLIQRGAEMNVSDITGAGQASDLTPSGPSNTVPFLIAGTALALAWAAWVVWARSGEDVPMSRYERRLAMRNNPSCGCKH